MGKGDISVRGTIVNKLKFAVLPFPFSAYFMSLCDCNHAFRSILFVFLFYLWDKSFSLVMDLKGSGD